MPKVLNALRTKRCGGEATETNNTARRTTEGHATNHQLHTAVYAQIASQSCKPSRNSAELVLARNKHLSQMCSATVPFWSSD